MIFAMKIFHINSYFKTNALHLELVKALQRPDVLQSVFIPLAAGSTIKIDSVAERDGVFFDSVSCFKRWHRFVWPYKMLRIWLAVRGSFERFDPDVVHAHSLIANGLFAYLLKRIRGAPFIVTVRGTDTEFFFEKSKLFVRLGLAILRSADAVILLSPGYLNKRLPHFFPKEKYQDLYAKFHVIPNGVPAEWREESFARREYRGGVLVFVGKLDKNKNLDLVIEVVRERSRKGVSTLLNVVGDGPELAKLRVQAKGLNCVFHGRLSEISDIKKVLGASDVLVLPSFKETFGLVYVEAMSQGLPVIYTKGQGFDGFFPEGEVGYAVDPVSVHDLVFKLDLIEKDYCAMSARAFYAAKAFDWDVIAARVDGLYRRAVSG